jgi:hypothetical protein
LQIASWVLNLRPILMPVLNPYTTCPSKIAVNPSLGVIISLAMIRWK